MGYVRQPDGTEIALRARGDKWCHWHEDKSGYTVVLEQSSGAWVYADVDADGELVPTSSRVGRDSPSQTVRKGLRPAKKIEQARKMRALAVQKESGRQNVKAKGTLRNLVVLVQFPDLEFTYNPSDFEKLYNEVGYSEDGACGSVKDYYKEVSYGELNIESIVVGPITVSHNYAYYGENAQDPTAVKDMVAEALSLLDAQGFDFSQCDVDGDGEIDGIDIIHAGYGAEYGGNSLDYIWSHKWNLRSAVYYDGVRIYNYHTEAEIDGWEAYPNTNKITPIGVICHETGHFLGLPDFYDTDNSSAGIGNFCLMSGGSWNGNGMRPAHMSAWCKVRLGWVTPTEIKESGVYSLPRVEDNKSIFKLHGNFTSEKEYFLIENRQGFGFDADLPGTKRGLLIWHVDDSRSNNSDETRYWVDLEEAGGVQDLESSDSATCDDSDYWRACTQASFSETSNPNSSSYLGGALGINISEISESREVMEFRASTSIDSAVSLGAALDNLEMSFTTGGDASWFGQSEIYSTGSSSAQSGVVADNKSSWLQTSVTGPGVISFKWKVSSENNSDFLRFIVNGSNVASLSGETGWLTFTTNLTIGTHTIRWSYVKDYSLAVGSDCGWVDCVQWTASSSDDCSAYVVVPQAGGSATSSAITLSSATVYNKRDIPDWVTSVFLNAGSSSVLLGGGGLAIGSTQAGVTGLATYTVDVSENTGPSRSWTWNIRSTAGDVIHTLVVEQPGTSEGDREDLPDLVIEPADGWPCGLFLSEDAESYDMTDEFKIGDSLYLNSCFGNVGAASVAVPFVILHEVLDDAGEIVASWRYDYSGTVEANARLCWFGATWEALNALPTGSYVLRCTLDADGNVEEGDETNNVEEYPFEIIGMETVTVGFDGNGGTVSSASQTYTVGSVYGSLPTAEHAAATFAGWYTSRVGGVRITEETEVSSEVVVLYAHWTEESLSDLTISVDVSETTVAYGDVLEVNYVVSNIGMAPASGVSSRVVLRYANSSQEECLSINSIGVMDAGESRRGVIEVEARKYTGTVGISAEVLSESAELDETNNKAGPIAVTFLPQSDDSVLEYGPFGSDDDVVSDAVAPTMIVNASVSVRGELASRNDCVAAFRTDTGELCGLGKILGDDGMMSMVLNINAGVKVHFKLWSSVSGLETPEILDCDADSDLTTPAPGTFLSGRRISFASNSELAIDLAVPKWHQVSFNVIPEDATPEAVFSGVDDKIGYVTSGSKYWSPVYGGTLDAVSVGAGYWVQTTEPNVSFVVTGTPDPSATISLKSGWNLIGYTPVSSAPVAKALASAFASGIISYVCYGSGIYPGTLTTMDPGKGYWVYAVRSGTVSYDAVSASESSEKLLTAAAETYGPFGSEDDVTGGDAVAPTIIKDAQIRIDGNVAQEGDCVAAYRADNGRLCGLARVDGSEGMFSMVLYLNAGTMVQFKIWSAASGTEDALVLAAKDIWVAPTPGGAPMEGVVISVETASDDYVSPEIGADPWPAGLDGFSMSASRTYDGMIYEDGVLVGTLRVKTTQAKKKGKKMVGTVSATVKTPTKTYTYSGATTSTGIDISNWKKKTSKSPLLTVTLGGDGMTGSFGEAAYITGARYVASRFSPYRGMWTTRLVDVDGNAGHLSFTVNAKGSVTVSGYYPDGRKAVGKTQMIVGEDSAWIPWAVKTPTGGVMNFVVRIMREEISVSEYRQGESVAFRTNDSVLGLVSEDGWAVGAAWDPDDARIDSVPFVRTQHPVIDVSRLSEFTTNYIGVAYSEKIWINETGYPAIFTASKLPTGLSIDKRTGEITGTPVRVGMFEAAIKVRSPSDPDIVDVVKKRFVIEKLPDWAYGTFDGCGTLSDGETQGEYGDSAVFTLSVTSKGKLSGKLRFKGLSYTLAASSFSEFYPDDMNGVFNAVAKSGSKKYEAVIMISGPYEGGAASEVGAIVDTGTRVVDFWGYKNLWGTHDYKAFAKTELKGRKLTLKGEDFGLGSGEKLVLSFDSSGKVKIAGTFVTADKNGRKGTYKASASTTICVSELYFCEEEGWNFVGDVYIYIPAKSSKKFKGFFRQVSVWCAGDFPLEAF